MNPLLDNEFLIRLNNDRNRTIYARIISLNQYEHPIEQLEGVVTAGSITIDGQSAVRRTCSLTLSAKNLNINNVYWGISTKVKIEIGLVNNIVGYENYDDIIWFKQGVFILTDFKTTQTLNNYVINLSGKDKMCLLNGDVSGGIPATTIFDSYTDRSGQSYIIQDENLYKNNETGLETYRYNNFIDDVADEIILAGFCDRYGSDYQYIRGVKKIIALSYKPSNVNIQKDNITTTIQFTTGEEPIELKTILSDSINDKGYYDVNLDEKQVYGFIVDNCDKDDEFFWEIEQKIPISIIIQELLHQYGQEKYSNIIIRNIEPYALEMLDNNSDKELYLLHDGVNYVRVVNKKTLISDYRIYLRTNALNINVIDTDDEENIINFVFENYTREDNTSLIDIPVGSSMYSSLKAPTQIIKKGDPSNIYTVRKVLEKEVAGYGMTLLVYPDELKGQPGDPITSILDKIVNMLGQYEYFYNLDGQFVFQAKPAYLQLAWNGTIYLDKENYIEPSELMNRTAYTFDNAMLTTQYQNTPNINNIKNDFIIWGERKNLAGEAIKFHGRYAIENIPLEYTDFNGYTWTSNREKSMKNNAKIPLTNNPNIKNANGKFRKYALDEDVDWRQLISLMADDWYAHHTEDDYEINLRQNNYWPDLDINLFPYGKTGYEQFYLDLSSIGGLWQTLYNTNYIKYKYLNQHPDLQKTQQQKDNYRALAILYDSNICKRNKYGLEDIISKVSISSYEIHEKSTSYQLVLNVSTEKDKELINKELLQLSSYIYNKTWENNGSNDYLLICYVRKTLITDNLINKNDSFILQLILNDEEEKEFTNNIGNIYSAITIQNNMSQYYDKGTYKYWNKNVIENPELLTFWFDFFKADEIGIGKFATSVIGDRPKTINDTAIKTIVYRDTPDIIYCDWTEYLNYKKSMVLKDGYIYVIVNNQNEGYPVDEIEELFSIFKNFKNKIINDKELYFKWLNKFNGSLTDLEDFYMSFLESSKQLNFIRSVRGKSVHEQAEDMLYQYSYYNDTVSINSVPLYYLQPNTTISIKDDLSKIVGYYIMNRINISLAYNGMMQITAIKSPERIY